jgi:hypothetical protein
MNLAEDEALVWGLEGRSSELTVYDFSQVLEATGDFSEENKLGQGGFGPVYKVIEKNEYVEIFTVLFETVELLHILFMIEVFPT